MTADDSRDMIAQAFVHARRNAAVLDLYPGVPPPDLATAYRIQDRAIALTGRAIGGWKVGRIGAPEDAVLRINRLAGPIFADTILDAVGNEPAVSVFGGFAAVEGEFMLRLRPPAQDGALPRTDAETLRWVDDVRIGIEIASSPYPGINADGPCVTVSDQGNNAGLLLGPPVADWEQRDLGAIEVETIIDGRSVGRATAAEMLDGPLGAVRFLLAHLATREIAPQAGWWVSSGAVTGVHPIRPGQHAIVRFGGVGSVACRATEAGPAG